MQDQELNNAFIKAVRVYFEDHDLEEMNKTSKQKYDKKYFDGLQKELAPDSKFYGKPPEEEEVLSKKKKRYSNDGLKGQLQPMKEMKP